MATKTTTSWGRHRADAMYGDGGDDTILGESDQDKLYGGAATIFEGGHGNDICLVATASSAATTARQTVTTELTRHCRLWPDTWTARLTATYDIVSRRKRHGDGI